MKPGFLLFFALLLGSPVWGEPLSIWISSLRDKVYYEKMVERYRAYVDSEFEAEVQAFGFREMPDKLSVAIRTGARVPDVVQLDEVFFGTYLNGNVPFVDLNEKIESSGLGELILPSRLSLFAHDGHAYGLAQSVSATVLYYRRDLLEKYGIDPSELSTWSSLRKAGRRMSGHGQALLSLDPSYFEILLRQRGSDLFGKNGEVLPDFDLAVETLSWLVDLQISGVALEPDRGTVFDPVFFNGDVANDEIAAIIGAEWYGTDLLEQFASAQKGKWGVLPLPAWTQDGNNGARTSTFSGQGLLIPSASSYQEDAWKFIHFVMTDYKANVERFTDGNSFPALKTVFEDPRLLEPSGFYGPDSLGKLVVELAPQVPEVQTDPRRPAAVFFIREGLFASVATGDMSAEEALLQFKQRLEAMAEPKE